MLAFSSFKNRPFFAFSFHKVKLIKVLFFCFLMGLIYGVLISCLNFDEVNFKCGAIVKKFLDSRLSQSFFATCFFSFLSYFIPLFFIFILGFVPISQLIFFIVPIFYGLGLGLTISCLIVFKGFEGLFVILLEIFPCALISILVLILSCKEGFRFSNRTFKGFFLKISDSPYRKEVKIYFLKFLTLLCFQLVSSIMDGFFNFVFFKI